MGMNEWVKGMNEWNLEVFLARARCHGSELLRAVGCVLGVDDFGQEELDESVRFGKRRSGRNRRPKHRHFLRTGHRHLHHNNFHIIFHFFPLFFPFVDHSIPKNPSESRNVFEKRANIPKKMSKIPKEFLLNWVKIPKNPGKWVKSLVIPKKSWKKSKNLEENE